MKGQLELFIIPLLVGVMFVAVIIAIFTLKIHIVQMVQYEYSYNNAQLLLLTLLSSTDNKIPISELIAEQIVSSSHPNIDKIISNKMDKLLKCYKLTYNFEGEDEVLLSKSQDCDPKEYTAISRLTLPSEEKPVALIKLVID